MWVFRYWHLLSVVASLLEYADNIIIVPKKGELIYWAREPVGFESEECRKVGKMHICKVKIG